jgi:WD40 repeat protein
LSDIAFAPDEKSVLALTYAGSEIPLKQFDLQTGKVRTVCHHAQSLVAAADGVYFLQFEPVSAMPESPRALMKISSSASEPEKVLDNFPYYALSTSGNRRWIVAQGKEKGIAIYDTRDQTTRVAGKNCQAAAVMSDSKVIYAVLGDLNADPAACGPGKPAQPGVR